MEKEIFRDKNGKIIGEVNHLEGEGLTEHFDDDATVHHLDNKEINPDEEIKEAA